MDDKITIERETLQAALKALDKCARTLDEFPAWSVAGHEANLAHQSIAELRAALAAQPAEPVEPVAWLRFQEHADRPTTVHLCDSDHPRAFQVYAAQPAPAAVPPDERIRVLREALIDLRRAYVRLMENGRDRIRMLGGECDPVDKMEQADPALRDAAAAIRAGSASTNPPKPAA